MRQPYSFQMRDCLRFWWPSAYYYLAHMYVCVCVYGAQVSFKPNSLPTASICMSTTIQLFHYIYTYQVVRLAYTLCFICTYLRIYSSLRAIRLNSAQNLSSVSNLLCYESRAYTRNMLETEFSKGKFLNIIEERKIITDHQYDQS